MHTFCVSQFFGHDTSSAHTSTLVRKPASRDELSLYSRPLTQLPTLSYANNVLKIKINQPKTDALMSKGAYVAREQDNATRPTCLDATNYGAHALCSLSKTHTSLEHNTTNARTRASLDSATRSGDIARTRLHDHEPLRDAARRFSSHSVAVFVPYCSAGQGTKDRHH